MIKLYLSLIVASIVLFSCDSNNVTDAPKAQGNLFVTSNPAGAEIWLDNVNSGKTTPDTIKNIDEGTHTLVLKLDEYLDLTINVNVIGGTTVPVPTQVLVSDKSLTLLGPVKIYATSDSTSSFPNGLDLSTGGRSFVTALDADDLDIYFTSTGQGFMLLSANESPNLIRSTIFQVGEGTSIFDGEDSKLRSEGTWTSGVSSDTANYIFLYDHDGHYSKLAIVNRGGGVAGEPTWVELIWYFNNTVLDVRF